MLTLPIKKKWFDMILSGEKLEEYREIKPYWTSRLKNIRLLSPNGLPTLHREYIRFRNGYSNNSPSFVAKCDLEIGEGNPEWGAEPNNEYYVLKILEIKEVSL